MDVIKEKMKLVADSNAFAVAMDVDAAGLPFLIRHWIMQKKNTKNIYHMYGFLNTTSR